MNELITIELRFFASLREQFGASERVQLPKGSSIAMLRQTLMVRSDSHAELLDPRRSVRCAVNQTMSIESQALVDGDEVAFFPPVTGG